MSTEPKRGRGRPPSGNTRELSVTCPPAMHEAVTAAARAAGISIGEWMRRAAQQALDSSTAANRVS